MSYTSYYSPPDDLQIKTTSTPNQLEVSFTCSRCGEKNVHRIQANELTGELWFDCYQPSCVPTPDRYGDHYGYRLTFTAQWQESILGELDRPLSPVHQVRNK